MNVLLLGGIYSNKFVGVVRLEWIALCPKVSVLDGMRNLKIRRKPTSRGTFYLQRGISPDRADTPSKRCANAVRSITHGSRFILSRGQLFVDTQATDKTVKKGLPTYLLFNPQELRRNRTIEVFRWLQIRVCVFGRSCKNQCLSWGQIDQKVSCAWTPRSMMRQSLKLHLSELTWKRGKSFEGQYWFKQWNAKFVFTGCKSAGNDWLLVWLPSNRKT